MPGRMIENARKHAQEYQEKCYRMLRKMIENAKKKAEKYQETFQRMPGKNAGRCQEKL